MAYVEDNLLSGKEFRKEFAQLMSSTSVMENVPFLEKAKTIGKIRKFVQPHVPSMLFRYRKCGIEELISFEQGNISMCVADRFSDKYDSTIYYDFKTISQRISDVYFRAIQEFVEQERLNSSEETDNPITNKLNKLVRLNYTYREIADALEEDFAPYLSDLESFIRSKPVLVRKSKQTKIACFTEKVTSKYMWDMYADGYKGFVLGYDLRNYLMTGLSFLYPIIYTSERFDATDIVERLCARQFFENLYLGTPNEDLIEKINQYYAIDSLYWIKLHLYKDEEEYAHEREWRLLEFDKSKNKEDFLSVPDMGSLKAIYYGPEMEFRYKEHLSEIAKSKGIDEYNVIIDENSRQYELKVLPIKK